MGGNLPLHHASVPNIPQVCDHFTWRPTQSQPHDLENAAGSGPPAQPCTSGQATRARQRPFATPARLAAVLSRPPGMLERPGSRCADWACIAPALSRGRAPASHSRTRVTRAVTRQSVGTGSASIRPRVRERSSALRGSRSTAA